VQNLFEKPASAVRFGTEKTIGFPRLTAIFGIALRPESSVAAREDFGAHLRIVGLAKC
jgi:hypothetical protein